MIAASRVKPAAQITFDSAQAPACERAFPTGPQMAVADGALGFWKAMTTSMRRGVQPNNTQIVLCAAITP